VPLRPNGGDVASSCSVVILIPAAAASRATAGHARGVMPLTRQRETAESLRPSAAATFVLPPSASISLLCTCFCRGNDLCFPLLFHHLERCPVAAPPACGWYRRHRRERGTVPLPTPTKHEISRSLGVDGRFVQNCTLSWKAFEIGGFHKRSLDRTASP
jgi:hypothetical protein